MTEARRLAAIMAVDVVGYSRLMGEDEAGTARAVREHREAAHAITLNANYGFPPTATSTVMIFNDRFTSTQPSERSRESAITWRFAGRSTAKPMSLSRRERPPRQMQLDDALARAGAHEKPTSAAERLRTGLQRDAVLALARFAGLRIRGGRREIKMAVVVD
jgi:hypothetical protein